MLAFFKRAARRPLLSFYLLFGTVAVSLIFTGVLQAVPHSDVFKGFYTAVAIATVIFNIAYISLGFVVPIYNRTSRDDDNANFFAYAFAIMGKIIAMSMLYTTTWAWEHSTFDAVHASSILGTWLYFVTLATYLSAATGGPATADTSSPFSAILTAFDIFFSKMLELCTTTVVVSNFYHLTKRMNTKREDDRPIPPGSLGFYLDRYSDDEDFF
jgi:hypothetical protein